MSAHGRWRSFARDIACTRCARVFALVRPHNLCPCGAPLVNVLNSEILRTEIGNSYRL